MAIDKDRAFLQLPRLCEQAQESRFSGTGGAYNGSERAVWDSKTHIREGAFRCGIAEGDMAKLNMGMIHA